MKADEVLNLINFFESNGVSVWLDGGWGVDALLGKETRSHSDLDIVVQQKDVAKLRKLLKARGYKDVNRDDTREWNFALGNDKGNEIDVHVIKLDKNGNGIYGPKENGEMYPAYSLKASGNIKGRKVQCLSAEYQVESHSGYKLGEKDVKDVTALCQYFDIDLPKEYSE